MSNKSVCVLAPNGRRQTVKVSPNTTILQIIEEVCKKQGLNPDEYDIKHFNSVLDTSSSILFSGLPNNAQLELLPLTKARAEKEVTIALNLESGDRLIGTFKPNNTLWEILNNLCPIEANLDRHPVVIYMRNEIYGDSLSTTNLKSLGITGGRAMLRLINRSPEELQKQPNVSAPLPSKPVEEKPYVRKLQKAESEEIINKNVVESTESNEVMQSEPVTTDEDNQTNRGVKQKAQSPTFGKNPNALLNFIKQEKKQKIDSFSTPGYVLKQKEPQPMEVQSLSSEPGKSVSSSSCDIEDDFLFLGERNAMLFSLETAESVPSSELPDDFFELTIDDAKKLLRDIKQRQHELENGKLLTSTMRNLEESKKQLRQLNKYKQSIIRIQFPDRSVLQGTFTPTETIGVVSEFVKEYLEDKTLDFYLYTTPPKSILQNDSRLMEIGCVPGAVLHFGTNTVNEAQKYLRSDLADKFTTNSIASLAASKMRKQSKREDSSYVNDEEAMEDEPCSSEHVNVGASTSKDPTEYEDYEKRVVTSSAEKVPKWFKPSK